MVYQKKEGKDPPTTKIKCFVVVAQSFLGEIILPQVFLRCVDF
jgi:hypothetical protein